MIKLIGGPYDGANLTMIMLGDSQEVIFPSGPRPATQEELEAGIHCYGWIYLHAHYRKRQDDPTTLDYVGTTDPALV